MRKYIQNIQRWNAMLFHMDDEQLLWPRLREAIARELRESSIASDIFFYGGNLPRPVYGYGQTDMAFGIPPATVGQMHDMANMLASLEEEGS